MNVSRALQTLWLCITVAAFSAACDIDTTATPQPPTLTLNPTSTPIINGVARGQSEEVFYFEEDIRVENCSPTGFISPVRNESQETNVQLDVDLKAASEIAINIPVQELEAAIKTALELNFGLSIGDSRSSTATLSMNVEPGRIITYHIIWSELWQTGSVNISNVSIPIPFRLRNGITFDLTTSQEICPATPTPPITPTLAATPTALNFFLDTVTGANLRGGPGNCYRILGTAARGTGFEIVAQSPDAIDRWYQIHFSADSTAWISDDVADVRFGTDQSHIPISNMLVSNDCQPETSAPSTVQPTQDTRYSTPVQGHTDPIRVVTQIPPVSASPAAQMALDSDGDGVPNEADQCPNERALNHPACSDQDADGFIDSQDECPTQHGTVRGCLPPPDGDQDGVENSQDWCQGAAGPASNNGCPVPP